MTERIRNMAKEAMYGEDKFPRCSISVENESELSSPKAIAEGLRRYFRKVPIKEYPGEKLFGRIRFSGCDYPSDFYRRAGCESFGKYWSKHCWNKPSPVFYWGWTHVVLDFDSLLREGLYGYRERICSRPQKDEFCEAMITVLDSLEEFSLRCAECCSSPRLRAILQKVPMRPAEDFYEAVQAVWFLFQLCADSLGRIDRYLYPYYKNDIESGKIDRDEAKDLLQELFVRVYETQTDNKALPISGHNHLVVGGYLPDGTDGFNELSRLVLECIAELPTFRPQASFRYTKYTSPETMRFITELNAKCQWIVFVNDEPRLPGMADVGIDPKDAVDYTVVGCNEWNLPCGADLSLAHVNLLHSLESLLYEDPQIEKAQSFDEVMTRLYGYMKRDMETIASEYPRYVAATAGDINVLTSALCRTCIERAKPFSDGGAKYHGITFSFNSLSNVADSLSVIKQFVFDEKKLTMASLCNMLRKNYKGYEDIRTQILRTGHFFGNDDDYVDSIVEKIVDELYAIRSELPRNKDDIYIIGSFVGATHPNLIFGRMTKATPDGRRDGDPFTMGIAQSDGKDKSGLSALLNSIAKLDYRKLCGCVVANVKIDKSFTRSEEKLEKLAAMYHTFLKKGGMQLQINYLSQEELLRAQKNPDEYRNLVVRVTGYSGYFTRFDTDLQNDIIRRTVERV